MRKIDLYSLLMAFAVSGVSAPTWAAPNLWWDHVEPATANQTDCVRQAETIMAAEKAGQTTSDADSVRAWSEKTIGVVECILFGDKLIVSLLVASDDQVAGNTLFNALRSGMRKK